MTWLGGLREALCHVVKHPVRFALSTAGFVLASLLVHLPHGPEHWSADWRTAKLSDRHDRQYPRIAIIEVNEEAVDQYPFASPINRKFLGDLVAAIDAADARAIGLDFIFDRHTVDAEDDMLARLLHDARARVVLGIVDERTQLSPERRAFQTKFLAKADRLQGHLYFGEVHHDRVTINADVVRNFAKAEDHPGETKSFAQLLVEAYGREPAAAPSFVSRVLSWLLVYQSDYIAWLRQPAQSETFLTLSADVVLKAEQLQLPLKAMLRDRIVLIGGNFVDRDQHLTPLSAPTGAYLPGVHIHAQVIAQLLDGRSIWVVARPAEAVLVIFFFLVGLHASYWWKVSHHWLEIGLVLGYLAITVFAFWWFRLIFPFASVLVAAGMGLAGGHRQNSHEDGGTSDAGH